MHELKIVRRISMEGSVAIGVGELETVDGGVPGTGGTSSAMELLFSHDVELNNIS